MLFQSWHRKSKHPEKRSLTRRRRREPKAVEEARRMERAKERRQERVDLMMRLKKMTAAAVKNQMLEIR